MDLVLDLLATVSRWSRSNLSEIALALVGCLLVLSVSYTHLTLPTIYSV